MVNMRKNQQLLLQKRKPDPAACREIRINVEITQSENNIFSFPELCKEAGIDLTEPKKKHKHYHSGSDTDDNSEEAFSDSESNNNGGGGKTNKKKSSKKASTTITTTATEEEDLPQPEEPQLNEPGDEFFKRILENSEKYAEEDGVEEEEEEEQSNRRKKRQERYDVSDPFIDDSDMVSLQAGSKSRPKIEGFYVWRGPLELEKKNDKTSGKKRTYKRKKKDNNDDDEEAGGTQKPRKKRNTKSKSSEELVKKDNDAEESKSKKIRKPRRPRKSKNDDSIKITSTGTAETTTETTTTATTMTTNLGNGSSSNNNNQTTTMDGIIYNNVQEQQEKTPKSSSNSNTSHDIQMKSQKIKNRSKGHKEQNNNNNSNTEPLNPGLEQVMSIFKNEISKESFQVKSRFPQNLKPTLTKLLSKAYEVGEFNENLFKILTNILPYNKFTITRLCYRTMYPKAIHDSRDKKTNLILQFKSAIDEAMPKIIKEYDERVAKIESMNANNPLSSPQYTPPPSSFSTTDMEIDDVNGLNVVDYTKAAANKSNNIDNDITIIPKKFKWDNHARSLLYQIIQTEMSIVVMCNQLAEAEERTERRSEQTSRKKLYQHLLTIWPDGWMTSNEIGKIYSAYKKKQKS